MENHREW